MVISGKNTFNSSKIPLLTAAWENKSIIMLNLSLIEKY